LQIEKVSGRIKKQSPEKPEGRQISGWLSAFLKLFPDGGVGFESRPGGIGIAVAASRGGVRGRHGRRRWLAELDGEAETVQWFDRRVLWRGGGGNADGLGIESEEFVVEEVLY